MNHFTAILDQMPQAMMVMFRLGGLMIFGPVFGSPIIPVRVKVFLSLLIGLAVFPLISRDHLAGQVVQLDLWTLAPMAAAELLVGLTIGFLASLPLNAMQTGGLLMGQQMGLGFAMFFNPAIDTEADVVGQVLFFMAMAGFLLIGGHEAMVLAVLHSFAHVPLGTFITSNDLLALLSNMLLASLELALRVAAPVLALVFLESVAMGFLSKTVPQLNILSLGFPLRILVGFAVIALGLTAISEVMMDGIDQTLAVIFEWVHAQGGPAYG